MESLKSRESMWFNTIAQLTVQPQSKSQKPCWLLVNPLSWVYALGQALHSRCYCCFTPYAFSSPAFTCSLACFHLLEGFPAALEPIQLPGGAPREYKRDAFGGNLTQWRMGTGGHAWTQMSSLSSQYGFDLKVDCSARLSPLAGASERTTH